MGRDGAGNSSNAAALAGTSGVDGAVNIQPGDRIALVPRQMQKLFADYAPFPGTHYYTAAQLGPTGFDAPSNAAKVGPCITIMYRIDADLQVD